MRIGRVGYTGWAGLQHKDSSAYALMQHSAGRTLINSASGQKIEFRVNNDTKFMVNGNQVVFGTSSAPTTESSHEAIQIYEKRLKIGGARGHNGMKCHGNSNWVLGVVANNNGIDCANFRTGGSSNHIINFTSSTSDTSPASVGMIRLNTDSSVSYSSTSDRRVKGNIRDLENANALQVINNLQPRLYHYKKDPSQKDVYGFVAQEVATAIPLWQNNDLGTDEPTETITDEDGNSVTQDRLYTIDYARFTPLLVGACKALDAENTALKAEVETLKNELAAIKAHLGL